MNNIKPDIDVLVVDDASDAANSYAQLIQNTYGLISKGTTDPEEAKSIVQHNDIKVIVLDQRMPIMNGTELWKEIKKIASDVKAILCTAQATEKEIGEAMNIGFYKYIGKDKIKDLPDTVLMGYNEYFTQTKIKPQQIPISTNFSLKDLRNKLCYTFQIVGITKIGETGTSEDDWKTTLTLVQGEENQQEVEVEFGDKISLTHDEEIKISNELNFSTKSLICFKDYLNSQIAQKYNSTYQISNNKRKKESKKYKITENNIEKQYYESAPIFFAYRIVIEKSCKLCHSKQIVPIVVSKQTNKIRTRIIKIDNEGKKTIIETGEEKL